MATKLSYNINSRNNTQIIDYGIISSIPTLAKKSITLTGTISINAASAASSGKSVTLDGTLYYKLNNGAETELCTTYAYSTSTAVPATASNTFSLSLNLSSVTKLSFKYDAKISGGPTATFNADIILNLGTTVSTETEISADWLKKAANLLGVSASATAGSVIKRSGYATVAAAAGANTPDATYPKASDLSAMVTAINGGTFNRSWDSTSSSDY